MVKLSCQLMEENGHELFRSDGKRLIVLLDLFWRPGIGGYSICPWSSIKVFQMVAVGRQLWMIVVRGDP